MTEVVVDNGKAFVSEESATIATEAAAQAKQWAEESERQANIATSNADTAVDAKDDAIAAKNLAQDWAVKMDGMVNNEDYSSKYYASQSASSASSAQTHKNNAQIWAEGTDAQVQGLGGEHSAREWAQQESSNYSVTATGSTTSRKLKDRFADIINVKDFGAKGDGVTDDTQAWNEFLSSTKGVKYIPSGNYLVNGEVKNIDKGIIGTAENSVFKDDFNYDPSKIIKDKDAQIFLRNDFTNEETFPAIAVVSDVNDNRGTEQKNRGAGIVSVVNQSGINGNDAIKSIWGISILQNSGDNDASGVAGYGVKYNIEGGVGDLSALEGHAWQCSLQNGNVYGGEIDCVQCVPGTTYGDALGGNNHSIALHLSSVESFGSPLFSGLYITGFGKDERYYGMWNAITIPGLPFVHQGNTFINGTVGINMGACNYINGLPDKAIKFGDAQYHLYRNSPGILRVGAKTIDFASPNITESNYIRLSSNESSSIQFMDGEIGRDNGGYNHNIKSEIVATGNVINLRVRQNRDFAITINGDASAMFAFPYNGDKNIKLGLATHPWGDIYSTNTTINTSDERKKTDIQDIDERVFKAWSKVNFKQFKFKHSVEEKGENARIHFGVIAQRVKEAFESEGLDGFKYGLLCYDEWNDEFEEKEITDKEAEYDEDGNLISPAETHIERIQIQTAGNAYGIRYGEALALECAYQRWKLEQMQKQLDKILNKDYPDNELTL